MKLVLKFRTRKSRFNYSKTPFYILICAASLIIITTTFFSLNKYYEERALPGTYILGANVSGMDYEQIVDTIDSQFGKVDLNFSNSKFSSETNANINDLKLIYDAPTAAINVLGENQSANPVIRFLPVWHKNQNVNYLIDGDKVNNFLMDKLAHGQKRFENANLVYNSNINDIEIVGGTSGLAIDENQTLYDIDANLNNGNLNAKINVAIAKREPKIKRDQAEIALADFNKLTAKASQFTADNHPAYIVTRSDIASIVGTKSDLQNGTLTLSFSEKKVKDLINHIAAENVNYSGSNSIELVDNSGRSVKQLEKGVDGVEVKNVDDLTKKVAKSLNSNSAFNFHFVVGPAKAESGKFSKIVVISLGSYSVTLYDDGKQVSEFAMYSGKQGWETPTGLFTVWYKNPMQRMKACARDQCWDEPDVPWVSY
ncbi:MAG: L,D-transpeptidase, partial [Bifidobacteriaceae bacterium]|nr:L,D-transpeptidase [Bifidobacteriaceae bacterium]